MMEEEKKKNKQLLCLKKIFITVNLLRMCLKNQHIDL